jgi:adenosylmethionine-8-amino-7-oxononanoate aminotransferase
MKLKSKSFISSTFWTDRIGPAAALETINIMEKQKTWNEISKIGNKVTNFWKTISKKYDLPVSIQGIPALANYSFKDKKNNSLYRSYLINQLLDKNFLSSNVFYSSMAHTDQILKKYFELLEEGFFDLKKSIENESIFELKKNFITSKTFR